MTGTAWTTWSEDLLININVMLITAACKFSLWKKENSCRLGLKCLLILDRVWWNGGGQIPFLGSRAASRWRIVFSGVLKLSTVKFYILIVEFILFNNKYYYFIIIKGKVTHPSKEYFQFVWQVHHRLNPSLLQSFLVLALLPPTFEEMNSLEFENFFSRLSI